MKDRNQISDEDLRRVIDETLTRRIIVLNNLLGKGNQTLEYLRKKFKIGVNEGRLIIALSTNSSLNATDISNLTGMHKVPISRSLAILLKRDYIGVGPDPVDGRRKVVSLTRAGRTVFRDLVPKAVAQDQQLRGVLTDEEQQEFLRTLDKLIASLGSSGT